MTHLYTLSNSALDVTFDAQSTVLRVTDKRCGKTWEQSPFGAAFTVTLVSAEGACLTLQLQGAFAFTATLTLNDAAELLVTVAAAADVAMDKLRFPGAFVTPNKDHYLLQTDGEGLLLPVDDTYYPMEEQPLYYCGGGSFVSWIGVCDAALATGYMAIFETAFDGAIHAHRQNDLITFAPVWLNTMGKFGYERKIRYAFFDQGGYVVQCKRYRDYIWPKNGVTTLKKRAERFPAIDKIVGAVHLYVWDNAREVSFAQELKTSGIEKALVLWDPNHAPYPVAGYDDHLKALGYASGAYELFTDIHPDDFAGNAEIDIAPLKRNVYPGLFETITSRKADGSKYSNQFGTYVCPAAVRPELIKRVEKELATYAHETYFLDVWQANGLYECHDERHPQTRTQYAQSIIQNYTLLEDNYKVFLGAEHGADFTGNHGVYNHGMMTLQRTWWAESGGMIYKPGSIHCIGDWDNHARPTTMLGSRTASDIYLKYAINEYTRVPLYELVYHDAMVSSWRWEDTSHHCPEIWWKKDLFNILYGTAPLWSIDKDRWAAFKTTFVQSYEKVCPWLQQICYDEMLSHRFVSEDRTVQESVFSSGKRAVVNFGNTPYVFEGQTVAPRGFITL